MRNIIIIFFFNILLFSNSFAQIKTEPLVIGEKFELYSKYNNTNYKISVCLPQGYEDSKEDYSCMYLFFGKDKKFLSASGLVTTLSDATGQAPRMIVVGVTNINWQRDLTPVPIKGRENSGGAEAFLSFVTNNLFKTIDNTYRTTSHRIFMGHSFGGLFGVYAFMQNTDYFDDYILISPSIAQRANYIEQAFEEKIKSAENLKNTFYVSVGDEGERMTRSVNWLKKGFEAKTHDNLKQKFEVFNQHNHHTLIPESLINGMLFIYKK